MMKTVRTFALIALALMSGASFGQINTPQPSSPGSVSSQVGLTDVKIDYFRPKVSGRKIFGEGSDFLQPYGTLWRTGANSGSVLTLSTSATIAETEVKAGSYLIFTVPGKDSWDFMLYSDVSLGGNTSGYDKAKEVLRTSVKPTQLASTVENLTFNISDISSDNTSANIELTWENVSIKVPMKVNFHDQVMKEIASKTQVNPSNYVAAANYYLTAGINLEQALAWMNEYLAVPGNDAQFWHVHTKAKIQTALGMKNEALATANESIAKAKADSRGDFGYIKRNEDLIAEINKLPEPAKKKK
jgi:hypothetical protein